MVFCVEHFLKKNVKTENGDQGFFTKKVDVYGCLVECFCLLKPSECQNK